MLFRRQRQIVHALLTRPPLIALLLPVRLACIRHAASVSPEPGSNSHVLRSYTLRITSLNDVFATSPVQGVQASPAKHRLPRTARVYDLKRLRPAIFGFNVLRKTLICLELKHLSFGSKTCTDIFCLSLPKLLFFFW